MARGREDEGVWEKSGRRNDGGLLSQACGEVSVVRWRPESLES